MYIRFALGFGSGSPARGCVICPGPATSFGFPAGVAPDVLAVGPGFGFPGSDVLATSSGFAHVFGVRVLLALLSTALLMWGTLYGYAVECVAAVVAALLVEVIRGLLCTCKEG